MTKKRKKIPKSSKKTRKTKERQENLIIVGIFLVFIMVVVYLFFMNIQADEDVVATVNGHGITKDELDWWYKVSIVPEYMGVITKHDFLVLSLIPQEVLMQKAKEERIKSTEDEVERLMGLLIIDNGLTLDEFEKHLNSRSITIEDIKKSFETRAVINKLLEKENINIEETGLSNGRTLQEYLDNLIDNSKIQIFPESVDRLVLKSFEETSDEICDEDKPIIRLYTTSSCQVCKESGRLFQDLVINFIGDESVQARHWSLDTGDNLLTLKKENGVPKEEVELFKKYSPDKLVPTIILGCKYKHVGKFGVEEKDEFKAILQTLVGN
ncbi:MAG: hypothetical protein QF568_02930 [Flavobacteriales bacterium]|nr:hypothetical protein [Flavobacteriales bacterium]